MGRVTGTSERLPIDGPRSLAARFWPHVDRGDNEDACWTWTRYCDDDGYGILCIGPARYRTHRVAWSLTQGPIPPEALVLHRCDNPPCCNPAHLFLGDHSRNQADTAAGRRRTVFAARRAVDQGQQQLPLAADDTGS